MGKFGKWIESNKPEAVNELNLGAATTIGTNKLGTVSASKFKGTANVSNVMEPYIREILDKQGVTPENAHKRLPSLIAAMKQAIKNIEAESGLEGMDA